MARMITVRQQYDVGSSGIHELNGESTAANISAATKGLANTAWEGLKLLLRVLNESSDGLTTLTAAVGGEVVLIEILEVCPE